MCNLESLYNLNRIFLYNQFSSSTKNFLAQVSTFQKEILLCHIDYQKIAVYSRQRLIVLKAVSIIKWNILVGQDITIYVDSQAALNTLTGHLVKSLLVSVCKARCSIRFSWVPGHRVKPTVTPPASNVFRTIISFNSTWTNRVSRIKGYTQLFIKLGTNKFRTIIGILACHCHIR